MSDNYDTLLRMSQLQVLVDQIDGALKGTGDDSALIGVASALNVTGTMQCFPIKKEELEKLRDCAAVQFEGLKRKLGKNRDEE